MAGPSRRSLFATALAGAAALPLAPVADAATRKRHPTAATTKPHWGTSIEGQRKADLGNGTYFNPIMPGDHPDPTILKDGADYYMTFTSFQSYPGLILWHSTDLVNWTPLGPALTKPIGNVFAVDLCKHKDRYYIYIPAADISGDFGLYVIWADNIRGPWSDPIDLRVHGCIDPGHVVGEDGKRYLFTNGIRRVRLTDDGLAADGALEAAYDPWHFPDDWVTENFAPEGPKLLRHNGYFYLVTAVGGTAGPVTGHMVIAARSKSIHGPWENCPHNPLVRTLSSDEPWWSRGHATLVEGPSGDWWTVYHGYENGFRTLGRQTLLEPIEWTADGWFRPKGGDLSKPIAKPNGGKSGPSGQALSDDFSHPRFGTQWSFFDPKPDEMDRIHFEAGGLRFASRGTSPADSAPLTCQVGDRSYQAEITLDLDGAAEAGLYVFYNHKAFVGVSFTPEAMKTWQYAVEQTWLAVKITTKSVRIRLSNDENVLTWHYSHDGGTTWVQHPTRMEVSGLNHNVFGGFVSLKIGVIVSGQGSARLSDFRYRAKV